MGTWSVVIPVKVGPFETGGDNANATSVAIDVVELSKILEGVALPPKKHRMRKRAEDESSIFKLQR